MALDASLSPPQRSLKAAAIQLDQAHRDAIQWADEVRQQAEQRLGIPAGDMGALEDPLYGQVLDWCFRLAALTKGAHELIGGEYAKR